jgi:hypothetical protein
MQARKYSLHVFVHPEGDRLHTDGFPVNLHEMVFIFRDGAQPGHLSDDTSSVDRTTDEDDPRFLSNVTYRLGWVDGEDARWSYAQAAQVQQSYSSLFLPSGLSERQVTRALRNHLFRESEKKGPKKGKVASSGWKPLPGVRYKLAPEMVMKLREVARKGAQAAAAAPSSGTPVVLRELREEEQEAEETKKPKKRGRRGGKKKAKGEGVAEVPGIA